MTLYLSHRHTGNCPMQTVTHAAPLWTCGCGQGSWHGPCSGSHRSQQMVMKLSLPTAVPLPPSTTCRLQQPTTASGTGPQDRAGGPQFPAGGELWGQGKKGKGNPSLPSPTPVRWHGGLNPSLLSNGRGLLTCTATCFKITHSDFSQVKFFISKPTDTGGAGGEGRLAACSWVRYAILGGAPQGDPEPQSQHGHRSHRPGPLGQWASTETVLPGSQGDWHWPLLASHKQGGRSQAEKRASPSCGQACSARPAHPCPDLAPGSHRCRKQPSKHSASFFPSQLAIGCVKSSLTSNH